MAAASAMMATSKHKMCCAEYRATIRSRWGFRASKWLQHHDGRAAGCTSIDHGKFCSSLSVRRGASLFFPCPQRRSTELWAREFQRSSPGSFGKTSKLSWTLKYEKPLPTCLKFQLRPKTLVFGPPLMRHACVSQGRSRSRAMDRLSLRAHARAAR